MMLNARQLSKGIITNFSEENMQQQGIDLNLIKVEIIEGAGFIPKDGKTKLPKYIEVDPEIIVNESGERLIYWDLKPGVYNITLEQGCVLPDNVGFEIFQRSSLLRSGTIIRSSWFDSGFATENIGTMLYVFHPIQIECGARVGQVIAHECLPVEETYSGQFQNDKQRN